MYSQVSNQSLSSLTISESKSHPDSYNAKILGGAEF